ncbi:sensor histidine kinase [Halogeometricum limi]|uniref:histidine kinase n=1 Tax=Halogeometricum limi TaxID=555875 RepID=A0A1I6FUL9_9EURY|nr:GAF domain-containing sensor histidine kinase [Halogeometricum limi]SFR33655.1 PAS domain S-box-containing protein [Halogeometricum limi]
MRGREQARFAVDGSDGSGGEALDFQTPATTLTVEDGSRSVDVVVVTDPACEVDDDVPALCYADCDPADVLHPERFEAFVREGDDDALRTQLRWILARADHSPDRETRLRRLYEGSSALISAKTTAELFDRTIDIADRILAFDNSSVCIDVGGGFRVRASDGDYGDDELIPLDKGILGKTYQTGRPHLVNDVRTDETAKPGRDEFRSAISVPIGDIGVFQAISTEVNAYDETDRQLAELLVSYTAETAARIESENALRESRSRVEALHRGTVELAAVTDLDELFERTVAITDEILSFDLSYVGIVEDGAICPAAMSEGFPDDGAEVKPLEEGGVAADVYRTGETRLIRDMAEADDADPVKTTYRSGLSVAIGDFAVFQAAAYTPEAFSEADAELTEVLMAHVAVTAERIRAEGDLRDERDRSTALFDHVSDAAVLYEVDTASGGAHARNVNRAFESQFDCRAVDVVGEDVVDELVPPEDDDPPELRVADGESYRGEVRRLADGDVRDYILDVVPLETDGTDDSGYALYTDITERKRREAELEQQNERLEEFANIVSHDLRNPLAVAQGHLELGREMDRTESFETVADALDQMEQLIDDLLSLARQGEVVGETDTVDVVSVARQAWGTVETTRAALETEATRTVEADVDRLAELFGNLFRNAVEHGSTGNRTQSDDAADCESANPPSGDDVTVTVGSTETGFFVADDGPGIAADRRDAVFEPGETTGDDGIGYGLAIVSRIADAHGWSVSVTESASGGARFEFDVD